MDLLIFTLLRAAGYLSIALGFALVFGAGRILNLSHGTFYLIAAYVAHAIAAAGTGGGVVTAYAAAVVAVAALGGIFFHLVIAPAAHDLERTMVLCLAANFVVAEMLRALFGTRGILVPPLVGGHVRIAGVALAQQHLLILPVGLALLAGTALVLYRTRAGMAIRAVAQDPEGAEILGIRSRSVLGWTFAAAAAMTAVASCLLSPLTVVAPSGWITPLIKSFAIVVLGGSRRP